MLYQSNNQSNAKNTKSFLRYSDNFLSYWVFFLFLTPDNKSLSSILKEVMKEKRFFGFQKYCPAFFWGLSLFVQKILLSYLRSKLMIHQPWVFRKSFFWTPSKTNSSPIGGTFVLRIIIKTVSYPFKQWSIFCIA